jgi:hypothetical protein
MELSFGNIFARLPSGFMAAGQTLLGHQHHMDHTMFCLNGEIEAGLLDVKTYDAAGMPLEAEVVKTFVLTPEDEVPGLLILKGRWHTLRAKKDGTRYMCVYAHRFPQALTMHEPGQAPQLPYTRKDPDGTIWYRGDDTIVQDCTGWELNYR